MLHAAANATLQPTRSMLLNIIRARVLTPGSILLTVDTGSLLHACPAAAGAEMRPTTPDL